MNIKKLFDYSAPLVSAATLLSASVIIVALIAAYTAYDIKLSGDRIEVTGSAKQSVVSDTARWIISLNTKTGVYDQQAGYERLENATDKITAYLESEGFDDYETPAITSYQSYSYPQYSEPVFTGYNVSRQVIVRSNDVEKISDFANNIAPLSGANYTVTTQSLELTYSKLADMRVALLSKAITDAKARAESIASESGRKVKALRTASSGVVQVLPQGGIDISDYGSYDTQSLKKDVMVTVRASFEL